MRTWQLIDRLTLVLATTALVGGVVAHAPGVGALVFVVVLAVGWLLESWARDRE